jgi:hypothetical protein
MRPTGRRHPSAGDVWILDEAQSLALVRMGENLSITRLSLLLLTGLMLPLSSWAHTLRAVAVDMASEDFPRSQLFCQR